MKILSSFLFLVLLTPLRGMADYVLIKKGDILNVFLSVAPDSNNIFTTSYYDSILIASQTPHDVFFCHIAKSIRLANGDIPLATHELIEAKKYLTKYGELKDFKSYLEIAEASLYKDLSKYEKATNIINQAIEGLKKSDPVIADIARLTKVNILVNWGKYDQGYETLNDLFNRLNPSLFSSEKQFNEYKIALWNRKSTALTSISNTRKDSIPIAIDALIYTLKLAQDLGNTFIYSNTTGNLSYIHYLNQEYEKMIPLALEDLAYSYRQNNVQSIGGLHTILADAYYHVGIKDSVTYHFKKAEDFAKYFRSRFFYNSFVDVAQRYYKELGDVDAAFESLNMQYEAINSIHKSINQINFDLSKAENNLSQAEERIQLLDYKNKQTIIISWLLGLLVLSIGIMAYVFYRLHHNQKKFRNELEHINHNLESEIERRTKEVVEQSEKIKAAAYHNSHRTRAPVARLLGLVDILNTDIPSEREEIAEYIRQSAKEIDEVIIDMNEVLSNN